MTTMTRRIFLMQGVASFVACNCFARALAKPLRRGCTMSGTAEGDAYFWSRRLASSGDVYDDRVCTEMAEKLNKLMRLNAGFAFYDDSEGHNAVADPVARISGYSDGTVLFGAGLYKREAVRKPYDGSTASGADLNVITARSSAFAAVYMVMAHEWAHIYQYKQGLPRELHTSREWRMEPHADYMAGWCLWRLAKARLHEDLRAFPFGEDLLVASRSLFDGKGDSDFTSPDHHGQEEYRSAMVRSGYLDGELDLDEVFRKGRRLVEL